MFVSQTQCAPVCNLKGILPQMHLSLPRLSRSWYKCPSVLHILVFPYSTGQGLEIQLNTIQGCWINSSHFAWRRYFLILCKCKHLQLLEWMYFSNMFGPVAGEDTKGSNFTLSFVHGYTWVIPIWYGSMSFCTNKSQMENGPPVSV